MNEIPFKTLESAMDVTAALEEAVSWPLAIILINVRWAPMTRARQRFCELEAAIRSRYPNLNIAFRSIDFTPVEDNYAPLRSLPGWTDLEQANSGQSLIHAHGEFAWIRDGRVLHVQRPSDFSTVEDLIEKTRLLLVAA